MKNSVLLTALTIGLVGIGSAQAQPPQDSGKMFDTLDSNGDGQLSADELKQMRSAMAKLKFQEADRNGDGQIDHDEFMAAADKRAEDMFKRMDSDGNGELSADEAKPRHHGWRHGKGKQGMDHDDENTQGGDSQMQDDDCQKGHHSHDGHHKRHGDFLKRMDSDGNGSVSRDEWNSAMQKMHERDGGDAG